VTNFETITLEGSSRTGTLRRPPAGGPNEPCAAAVLDLMPPQLSH